MIEKTTEKADDALATVNDFLKGVTDKITPNFVLLIALVNGVLIGLVTTGYLGASSVPVKSFTFALIIWQFVAICFLTARYVELNLNYLNKFVLSGLIGYYWQWQIFAMLYPTETFMPPFGNNGFGFIGYISVLIFFGYCLNGNKKAKRAQVYSLDEEKHVA